MTTLNTFNSHLNDSKYPAYTGDYYFYLVDFMDIYSGQHYFRVIDAGVSMSHDERMAHFDGDINGTGKHYDPRYEITAYEIDLEPGEMPNLLDCGKDLRCLDVELLAELFEELLLDVGR